MGPSTPPPGRRAHRGLVSRITSFLRTISHLGMHGSLRLLRATTIAPAMAKMGRLLVAFLPRSSSPTRAFGQRGELDVLALEPSTERVTEAVLASAPPGGMSPASIRSDASIRVRKSFRDRKEAFRIERRALRKLGRAGIPVSEIVEVDGEEPALVVSFQGQRHVTSPAAPELVTSLNEQMHRIHRAGFVLGGFRPEMVVVGADGAATWVDFTTATDLSWLPWELLRFIADDDIEAFNEFFETSYPTYRRLAAMGRSGSLAGHYGSYSALYLGAGIRTGPIWSLGSGWGRWESILRTSLPDIMGKRILDLGANNGHNGLEMLRSGAREVVGVELNPERVTQAERLKQAYEWSDGRSYHYSTVQADMRDAARLGLGAFDVVTALCSLYYLAEDEMVQLLSELMETTPVVVLECNQRRDIGRSDPDTYRRASLEFNFELLKRVGLRDIDAFAPSWSQRPVLVGRR